MLGLPCPGEALTPDPRLPDQVLGFDPRGFDSATDDAGARDVNPPAADKGGRAQKENQDLPAEQRMGHAAGGRCRLSPRAPVVLSTAGCTSTTAGEPGQPLHGPQRSRDVPASAHPCSLQGSLPRHSAPWLCTHTVLPLPCCRTPQRTHSYPDGTAGACCRASPTHQAAPTTDREMARPMPRLDHM